MNGALPKSDWHLESPNMASGNPHNECASDSGGLLREEIARTKKKPPETDGER